LLTVTGCISTQNEIVELTNDGTWCWFSDPRAILTNSGDEMLVTGFVKEDGSVTALQYSLSTGKKSEAILSEKLEVDDHNNPAFVQHPDGHFLAFFTKHHNTNLYMCVTQNSTNDQARPVVAKAAGTSSKTVVLWNAINRYVHYTDFRTALKVYVDLPLPVGIKDKGFGKEPLNKNKFLTLSNHGLFCYFCMKLKTGSSHEVFISRFSLGFVCCFGANHHSPCEFAQASNRIFFKCKLPEKS
jgi:hypothetical protein